MPSDRASLWAATAIVVGNMIGTGLYTSLGFQVAEIQSGFVLLALWAVGGLIALCGALSYAELASALPRSGGEYHFLSRILHPLAGFLSGWISVTVGFAAPVALAAMAFGTYLNRVNPAIAPLPVSLGLVIVTAAVFLFPLRVGSRYLGFFVLFNVAILVVLVAAAFGGDASSGVRFLPAASDLDPSLLGPFAISLIYVLYSYSGWNASVYVISEVVDARRVVPRSLILGTVAVTVLYVGVNAAFLLSTPMSELEGQLEVGLIAGRNIFGDAGANLTALAICVGLAASVAAMTWAGPRVTMAMGEDYRALRVFSRKSSSGIPYVAILFQAAVSAGMLVTSTFEAVITYTEFVLILSSGLTVAGVFMLRRRRPELAASYKTWGYPVTPLIFLGMSSYILVFVLVQRPRECLLGLATVALGAVVWWLSGRTST